MTAQYLIRIITNTTVLGISALMVILTLCFLISILWVLCSKGFGFLSPHLFTQITPPPGESGGLLNAIVGSLYMVTIATLIGAPVGIMAGTYLAEFGRNSPIAAVTRFINDILLSAPSIVIGLFIYSVIVSHVGHFSGWAGAIALSLLVLPVVVRTSENMLSLVPNSLREAAAALGAPQWKIVFKITYKAARSGIMTGILLAVARISGETAPLLFTALNNQFWSSDLNTPMASLSVIIFQFAMSPYKDWQNLAWAGALLITLFVLTLNILTRLFLKKSEFY